jgi:hypothetical protein
MEGTRDRSSGQPTRHPAGLTHLTIAGESLHAPVRVGMEDARAGAKPRLSHRDLRRRPRDPVPERQSRRSLAATARDHEKVEAHGQRGENTNLQGAGRRVRLLGLLVRAHVLSENRSGTPGIRLRRRRGVVNLPTGARLQVRTYVAGPKFIREGLAPYSWYKAYVLAGGSSTDCPWNTSQEPLSLSLPGRTRIKPGTQRRRRN